jgi:rubrerythrin
MVIHTASEGVTLARTLESDSAGFYENAAKRFPEIGEKLLALAKENKKNISQVERAYYGVITDAIEGCYAFNLDPENYTLDIGLPANVTKEDVISRAVKTEETIINFYKDAAEQSKSLMADVPRNFTLIAKKRESRKAALTALLAM